MNAKKIIGGILAGALMLTSVPLANVGSTTASAAEGGLVNLAEGKSATVSHTESTLPNNNGAKLTDGDTSENSRWSTDGMKDASGPTGKHVSAVIDLEKASTSISYIKIYYYRLVWSNNYEIQTADTNTDNTTWETLKVFNRSENEPQERGGTDTVYLDENQSEFKFKRYARFLFKTVNPAAGGSGVSIREIEMYGKEEPEPVVSGITVTATAEEGKGTVTVENAGADCNGQAVDYGTKVTLTATPAANYSFSYWLDSDTKKILSNSATFDLTALKSRNVTPVFTEKESAAIKVTFRMPELFGNKLIAENTAVNGLVDLPTVSLPDGYTLTAWVGGKDSFSPADYTDGKIPVTASVTLVAKLDTYKGTSLSDRFQCYVLHGTIFENGVDVGPSLYRDLNSRLTFKAVAPSEDQKFSHWEAAYGSRKAIVSTNPELIWTVKGHSILTAVFTTETVTPATKPTVSIGLDSRTTFESNGITKNKLRLQVVYDNANGFEIIEKGLLVSLDASATEDLLTVNNGVTNENVKRFYSNSTAQTGSYIVNATTSSDKTVKYRGYVIYKDADGNLKEAYTEMMESAPLTAAN